MSERDSDSGPLYDAEGFAGGGTLPSANDSQATHRHRLFPRILGGVFCGLLAGALIPMGLQTGIQHHFPNEFPVETWKVFYWTEHWALRVLASWVASLGAGFIAGLAARERGRLAAAIAVLPTTLCWAGVAYMSWSGAFLFGDPLMEFEVSIGNKLAATLLALSTIPIAVLGGAGGEEASEQVASHFDSRQYSLFGIKWFHYLWLPIFIHVVLVVVGGAGLYGLQWVKLGWQAGMDRSFLGAVPMIFTLLIWGTFWIIFTGAARAYEVLAGFVEVEGAGRRFLAVVGNGPGKLILGIVLQGGVLLLHAGLAKLVD